MADSDSKVVGRTQRRILGIGYWVQGFRCLPWMAVIFFLKDGVGVDPSTIQLLLSSANLPMVAKPLYGVLSDALYLSGQHRIPYIAFGAFLQALSWLALAIISPSSISITTMALYLLLSNLGASIAEVANDAIVAEVGKQQQPTSSKTSQPSPSPASSSSSGELQSFVWIASSAGGVLGNLLGGLIINRVSPQKMFLLFGLLASLQLFVTIMVRESSLNLPKRASDSGVRKQLSQLTIALRKPAIARSITWFALSYAVIPALTGTMFFYQTEHLKIDSSVLGISKVFGQVAMLLWSIVYNGSLKRMASSRTIIAGLQVAMALFMLSDVLFVKGVYRSIGVPDGVYVVIFSGLLEVLFFFKILPFSVVIARLCPAGCEGSLMALVMSAVALAMIVSGYLGVALAAYVGVTPANEFSGLPKAIAIQAVCTLVPLFWSSCIPEDEQEKSSSSSRTKSE
ncbi:probable folate-biopterin transporter 7 [Humulus lupulus]|uniref:probable folate-biopterin transporter 7 n=1 Tax=Humulus lupulus TaxID=3486 RepID=UPI002B416344|nr:probable folate-biopterin transporter 7 [Humulus lupulus]